MKYLGIVVVMLAIVGCSNTPSKLERIEANEEAILELQTRPDPAPVVVESDSCPAQCTEAIDRAFEKSQYK
jgi:hypothetical protein